MNEGATNEDGEAVESGDESGVRLDRGLGVLDVDRGRVALWVVAFAFAVVFAFLVWQYVGTVVLGVFAYYVSRPVFSRFVHPRIESRTVAVAVTLFTVGLPVLALVAWTVVVAVRAFADVMDSELSDQLTALVEPYANLDSLFSDVPGTIAAIVEDPMRLADPALGAGLGDGLGIVLATVGQLFTVLVHAFVVLIVTFYLLRDDYRVAAWARGTFVEPGGILDAYFVAVDRDLKNVFFGNILNALLTGFLAVLTFVALNLVSPPSSSIPEPLLLGLIVGVASLVPVIGIKLVTLPLAAYLFGLTALSGPEDLWFPVAFLAISFVVVDYIPDQLLRPYVSGRSLHVGAVMLAYTLGPFLFGWYGLFLGPFVLVVLFEFARIVVPWLFHPEREVPELGESDDVDGGLVDDSPRAAPTLGGDESPDADAPPPTADELPPGELGEPTRSDPVDAHRGVGSDDEAAND
ncbi:AI-2E family transporter [Halorubellus sp. JP-L1]|uniref:AI-2E family transporter n=1 Tax=Halorubellus sp. JP-L1 TaxID=2715753 RepID=UPI00140929AE|nr:AI-2E family transporter [Halorubellus sp. JP-L1]NHN42460.1 AI-2E family transporter [Halorubellus sp. JP-L1]